AARARPGRHRTSRRGECLMANLRKLLLDAARDPFLAEALRADLDAAATRYTLPPVAAAALKNRDAAAMGRALGGVFAPARPSNSEELVRLGIGVFLWPGFLSDAECVALRSEADGAPTAQPTALRPQAQVDPELWRPR